MLRSQLSEFAEQCELKLQKNDHKTEWRRLPVAALVEKLEIEVREMKCALQYEGAAETMNECVDIANFAMMLWDRLRQDREAVVPAAWRPTSPTVPDPQYFTKPTCTPVTHLMPSDDGLAPVPADAPEVWTRHGTWVDGNREVAKMYKWEKAGEVAKIYYEDTPEVRSRGLPIISPYIAKRLEEAGRRV